MAEPNRPLWDAINEYAAACGGDTSNDTISDRRMNAVREVERALLSYRSPAYACADCGARMPGPPYPAGHWHDCPTPGLYRSNPLRL